MDTLKIEKLLVSARHKLTGVNGLLLAGTDGRPVAQSLDTNDVNPTAAVSASSLQLARRLADLLGDGSLEEITVRSSDGYVIVTPVGDRWVLTALTVRSANVARINLVFRDLCPNLAGLLVPTTATISANRSLRGEQPLDPLSARPPATDSSTRGNQPHVQWQPVSEPAHQSHTNNPPNTHHQGAAIQ